MAAYKIKYTYEVEVEAVDKCHASEKAGDRLSEDIANNYLPKILNEEIEEIERAMEK